jgi:hypothetical protein
MSAPKVEIFPKRVVQDESYLPQFPTLAGAFDQHARRVPWWAWTLVGYGLGSGLIGRLLTRFTKPMS